MPHNMGRSDRLLRTLIVAPAAIVVAILAGPGSIVGVVLLVVAAAMLLTSAAGSCPLYSVLGISTCHPRGDVRSSLS